MARHVLATRAAGRMTAGWLMLLGLFSALVPPALAQSPAPPATDPATAATPAPAATPAGGEESVDALIARVRERIQGIDAAARARDEALRYLKDQVDAATGAISGRTETNEALRQRTATLSDQVQELSEERQKLTGTVDERASAITRLTEQVAQLEALLQGERSQRSGVEQRLATASQQLTQREQDVASSRAEADALTQKLQAALATGETQTTALDAAQQRLASLDQQLTRSRTEAEASAGEVQRLGQDVQRLRDQLEVVSAALAQAGDRAERQNLVIGDLTQKLNTALAAKVEELAQYRSEFFGRLKQILGDRPDFRVVGDRFVFQAEVLFASGSAQLDPNGQARLRELATTLKQVAATIPTDIVWILRVDGHTDTVPISNERFASNWDLSSARAISVVQFLVREGIPPERLVAAGFGEFQPLDNRGDEIANRRNRRIEFKLTER